MNDRGKEIKELLEKTRHTRREFLRTDLQTCRIALERAQLELSLGNTDEARRELAAAERGAQVIQGFLGEAPGQNADIAEKLEDLRASLRSFRSELD
jgi:hypothetical protein